MASKPTIRLQLWIGHFGGLVAVDLVMSMFIGRLRIMLSDRYVSISLFLLALSDTPSLVLMFPFLLNVVKSTGQSVMISPFIYSYPFHIIYL